jgi:hypothetical protein
MENSMLTKTKLALAAVLFAGSASIAVAQDADPILLNRYPQYNGVVTQAPQATFQSSAVSLQRGRQLQSAPVRLQENQDQRTKGAGRLPHAFQDQQQIDYPQSPPGGGY